MGGARIDYAELPSATAHELSRATLEATGNR